MIKRILSLVLAAGVAACASADSYNYLNIITTSSVRSVALKTVKKITFSGTDIVVTTADGTTTTAPMSTLTRLTFTDTATGIASLQGDAVLATDGGQLQIFNASGQLVRQQYADGAAGSINLNGLPHGIYIVRIGQKNIKIRH